jgi:PAS domain-containing protein
MKFLHDGPTARAHACAMAVSTDGPVTEVVPAALDARTRVQAMTRGVDFTWVAEQLLQQRDDLLDRWQQAAAAQPFHAGRLEGAVANHIPALVDALIVVLRRVAPSAPSMSGPLHDALVLAAAEDHARVRMAQGLTAADIVTEFRLLRQEIGRALRFNVADTAPTSDVLGAEMLLHDALDDAAFLAVFAMDAKEAELRRLQDALTAVSRDVTERERAENHLLRLNERLRALLDTGQALAGTLDPDALLDGLLERVVGLLPNADFGLLYLHDPESGDLVARAHIGLDPAAFAQLRLRPGESTSGIVFQSGRPLRVGAGPDADTDMAAIELTRSEATRRLIAPGSIAARVVSSLTVPLRTTGGIVIGTLSAASTTTDFSEDDLPLMEGVFTLRRAGAP